MPDPIQFSSISPRYSLPLLFAGQAQKEVFVNEALSLADTLMHCAIDGEASTPPVAPLEGECWLINASASGEWAENSGKIASWQSGQWLFIAPKDGMRLLDRSTGQERRYWNGWKFPPAPVSPTGGATVDSEARAAILDLISKLKESGLFPTD